VTPWVACIQPLHPGCQRPARKRARESPTRHEADHRTKRCCGGQSSGSAHWAIGGTDPYTGQLLVLDESVEQCLV